MKSVEDWAPKIRADQGYAQQLILTTSLRPDPSIPLIARIDLRRQRHSNTDQANNIRLLDHFLDRLYTF